MDEFGLGQPVPGSSNAPTADRVVPLSSVASPGTAVRLCPTCGAVYGADALFCQLDGTRLRERTAHDCDRIGEVIDGRYTILGLLGQGAMGVVFRAIQRGLEREVAIKVLKQVPGEAPPGVRRFLREVRTVSQLNHRNVVIVHDFGRTTRGELYLAMELLRGITLRKLLDAAGPLPLERTATLMTQVCDGLAAAHARGIIHRDLKPSNVIVLPPDELNPETLKLLDFGLAKADDDADGTAVTRTGHICGTPLYMSPEQALGLELDCRSDVYAAGLLAYEMLAGSLPFRDRAVPEVLRERVHALPPPMATTNPGSPVHPAVEAAVMRALSRDPEARPDSALAFKAEFERALAAARKAASAATASLRGIEAPAAGRRPAAPETAVGSSVVRAAEVPVLPSSGDLPGLPEIERTRPMPSAAPATGRSKDDERTRTASTAAATAAATAAGVNRGRARATVTPKGTGPAEGARSDGDGAARTDGARGRSPATGAAGDARAAADGRAAAGVAGAARRRRLLSRGDSREGWRRPAHARGAARGGGEATQRPLAEQVADAERLAVMAGDGPRRPWCEVNLAELLRRQGRAAAAEAHAREALRLLRGAGDPRLQTRAAELLADIAEAHGDIERTCDWLQLADEWSRTAGSTGRRAAILGRLGGLLHLRRHYAPARAALTEAVALDREAGDRKRLALNLRGLGVVQAAHGKHDEAEVLVRESLEIEERSGDRSGAAWCQHHLGRIAEARGAWEEALRCHEKALTLRRHDAPESELALSLRQIARPLVQLRRLDEAHRHLDEALAISSRLGDDAAVAVTLRHMGDVLGLDHSWPAAVARYEQSEAIFRRIGSPLAGRRAAVIAAMSPDASDDALARALEGADS